VIHGLRSLEQSQEIGMREVKSVCSLGALRSDLYTWES
jgi:hypothetical protein